MPLAREPLSSPRRKKGRLAYRRLSTQGAHRWSRLAGEMREAARDVLGHRHAGHPRAEAGSQAARQAGEEIHIGPVQHDETRSVIGDHESGGPPMTQPTIDLERSSRAPKSSERL